jgi:hypothetical protein
MHVKIVKGNSTDKNMLACYIYLKEKYRREKPRDRNLRAGQYGRTGKERIQLGEPSEGMSEESRNK